MPLKDKIKRAEYSRLHRIKNKEAVIERGRLYRLKNKDKELARHQIYRAANRIKERKRQRLYRLANKEKTALRHKIYYDANKDKAAAYDRIRRARKLKAKGSHTRHDVDRLYFKQRGRCAAPHCRALLAFGYHVDHKIPLSRGGSNYARNLQLMCQPCNDSKGTRTMKEWLKWVNIMKLLALL